jgi:hypothetical protein
LSFPVPFGALQVGAIPIHAEVTVVTADAPPPRVREVYPSVSPDAGPWISPSSHHCRRGDQRGSPFPRATAGRAINAARPAVEYPSQVAGIAPFALWWRSTHRHVASSPALGVFAGRRTPTPLPRIDPNPRAPTPFWYRGTRARALVATIALMLGGTQLALGFMTDREQRVIVSTDLAAR